MRWNPRSGCRRSALATVLTLRRESPARGLRAALASSSRSSTATATFASAAPPSASGDRARARMRTESPRSSFPTAGPLNVTVGARGFSTRTCGRTSRVTQGDGARVPARAPVADLRRDGDARAGADAHPAPPAVPRRVEPRPRQPDRVPAVVDNGVAYIGNARATIRAISMRTGKVLWRHDTPNGQMASSLAVVGDRIVYHSMNGRVVVLDRATGRERWEYVVRLADRVVAGGAARCRLLRSLGRPALCTRPRPLACAGRVPLARRSPRARRSTAVACSSETTRADCGRSRRAPARRAGCARVNGRIYGTPAVLDGRVFVPSSTGGSLTAFSTRGRYLWRVDTGSYVYSSPAAWGGGVFFGSYNGVFYGVSAASGRIRWEIGTGGPISGAAVVVDGIAYAGSFAHRIVGVDARSGRVLLRFGHGNYVPVSGNGKFLLFHGYSRLYAVEPKRAVTRVTATHHQRHLRHERK